VVPPGCLHLPLAFVRDGGFCGLVDEKGDVSDCAKGSFRALEVCEVHSRSLYVAAKAVPVGFCPVSVGFRWWVGVWQ